MSRKEPMWTGRGMRILLLSLIVTGLLTGCVQRISYPAFPFPSHHVQEVMNDLAKEDREIWEWWNKLAILARQLGAVEEE